MRPVSPPLWLSPRGVWLLLGLAAIIAIGSVASLLVGIGYLFSIVFIGAIVIDLRFGPTLRTLKISREAGRRLFLLGHPAPLAYTVENLAPLAVRLGLVETPAPLLNFEHEILNATVAATSHARIEQMLTARQRGATHLGDLYLWAESSIGIIRRRFVVPACEDVKIFPDLRAVERFGALASRRTLLDRGLRKLRLRGAGSEFESLREYTPDDAFRSIDWKATARRGHLVVQQYEVERSQQVIVALDCGRLMTPLLGTQHKFDYALTAGLCVARLAQAADDHVGLWAFAAKPILSIAPRRGRAHVGALVQAAFDVQPRWEESDYERTFLELESRHSKRSLIVFFTDIFDPAASVNVLSGLGRLARRHLVVCVLMNDAALADALAEEPHDAEQAYRVGVAMRLTDERAAAIAQLRSLGIIIVDVPAPQLTVALLETYLDCKARRL